MLTVYRSRGQGKLGVRKQHIKLINQDLHFFRLTRSFGKEGARNEKCLQFTRKEVKGSETLGNSK